MMIKGSNVLSTKQLFAVLFCMFLGRSLVGLPVVVTKYAGQDGWIAVLLAGIVGIFSMNVILWFLGKYPGLSFNQLCEKILGKYFGKIPGFILYVYYTIFSVLAFRIAVDLVDTWFLPRTPIEILSISLLGLSCYLIRNGIKVIGRFNEIVVQVILPLFPLFIVPLYLKGQLYLLLPVGSNGLMPILRASLPGFYAFLGFESIFILYAYARETANHQEVVKTANIALFVVLVIKLLIVISTILVFGDIEIQFFQYPVLEYFKLITLPVVERVEFVLIYFWLLILFGSVAVLFALAVTSFEQAFKLEGYKNTAFFLAIPIYYLLKVPQNMGEVSRFIEYFSYIGFAATWGILSLLLMTALIRGRGKIQ